MIRLFFVCTMILSQPLAKSMDHLSAAFDTIDHDNLFYILEQYVGIDGSALRLIRSYFVIVHKEFKLMVLCLILQVYVGCHRAQVLGPMKFVSTWCDNWTP